MCVVQERNQLSIQLTNLQVDFDNVNARLEEETENATSLRSQLQKAVADYQTLKSRFDKELLAKTEELEEIRSAARDWVLVCGRSGGGSRKVWAKRPSGSWGQSPWSRSWSDAPEAEHFCCLERLFLCENVYRNIKALVGVASERGPGRCQVPRQRRRRRRYLLVFATVRLSCEVGRLFQNSPNETDKKFTIKLFVTFRASSSPGEMYITRVSVSHRIPTLVYGRS